MKKTLMAAAFAICATAGFAQTMMSPAELCTKIARVNGSNGAICAQLISRNTFDPAAISIADRVLAKGSSYAIEVLNASANKMIDVAAGQVCERVADVNGSNTIPCVNAIANTRPSLTLLQIATAVLPKGSSFTIEVLNAGANAFLSSPLASICESVALVNGSNAVVCVQVIANKVTMNNSEEVCRASLNRGSSYAIECLRGIVMDYVPVPQPTTIMVDLYKMQDLKRSLLKAKAQLNRGMIENAQRTLEEASQSIDLILNEQPLR